MEDLRKSIGQCKCCQHCNRTQIDFLLLEGLSGADVTNVDIARRFGMSEASVRRHLKNHFKECETCERRLPHTYYTHPQDKVCVACITTHCPICGEEALDNHELCARCAELENIEMEEGPYTRRVAFKSRDGGISSGRYIDNRNLWDIERMMRGRGDG